MKVSCIVAVDHNFAIGSKGQIPWYLPADLKYFRKITTPHHVIMGRQTFESMGKSLRNRINIIITRDPYYLSTGCLIAHSVEEALSIAMDHGESEAFIIGGAQVYQASLSYWDRIYLTRIDLWAQDTDAFFPKIELEEWSLVSTAMHPADDKNKWQYTFEVFERKI